MPRPLEPTLAARLRRCATGCRQTSHCPWTLHRTLPAPTEGVFSQGICRVALFATTRSWGHLSEVDIPFAIILCWESFNVRCHRRLVAEWLEEKLGIVVPELDHERTESLPFSEQPSKWDAKPKSSAQLPMTF